MKSLVLTISAALFLASCAQTPPAPPAPKLKDGEITVPANYKSWPKFLPSRNTCCWEASLWRSTCSLSPG